MALDQNCAIRYELFSPLWGWRGKMRKSMHFIVMKNTATGSSLINNECINASQCGQAAIPTGWCRKCLDEKNAIENAKNYPPDTIGKKMETKKW